MERRTSSPAILESEFAKRLPGRCHISTFMRGSERSSAETLLDDQLLQRRHRLRGSSIKERDLAIHPLQRLLRRLELVRQIQRGPVFGRRALWVAKSFIGRPQKIVGLERRGLLYLGAGTSR